MAKKKPVDEESWCLSLEDLAVLLDGFLDELSKEGAATVQQVVAGLVAGSGRFDDQIATLRAMKDAAGCESLGVTTRSVSLAWRDFRGGIATHGPVVA